MSSNLWQALSYIYSSLKKGEYQEAGRLYKKVLPLTMNEHGQNDKIIGDIHVKLAAVYQSKGKLKASVDHLTSAREIYENVLEGDSKSSNEHAPKLKSKIIDILKTIASLQVATEQVEDADKSYKVSGRMYRYIYAKVTFISLSMYGHI